MNTFLKTSVATLALVSACGIAYAQGRDLPLHATEDEGELQRGAVPDVSARQRYNTAIREAYGAYKNNLAECRAMQSADRAGCTREAKAQFERDKSMARSYARGAGETRG